MPVVYKIETDETEQIALTHIAKTATRDGDGGAGEGRSQRMSTSNRSVGCVLASNP